MIILSCITWVVMTAERLKLKLKPQNASFSTGKRDNRKIEPRKLSELR